jgi:hypothetical protein
MESERKRLEFESDQLMHSSIEGRITRDEETAREIAERLPGMKAESAELAVALLKAGLHIAKLNQS